MAEDFDREIIVKVNVAEVLRDELARKRKLPPRVAFGTNTDVYLPAEADATDVYCTPLYLASGVKQVFFDWLRAHHPQLVREYAALYAKGSETPRSYRDALRDRLFPILSRHGLPQPGEATADKFALHGRRDQPEPPLQDTLFGPGHASRAVVLASRAKRSLAVVPVSHGN